MLRKGEYQIDDMVLEFAFRRYENNMSRVGIWTIQRRWMLGDIYFRKCMALFMFMIVSFHSAIREMGKPHRSGIIGWVELVWEPHCPASL